MNGGGFLIIIAAVVIFVWWLDVHRRPIRQCPACNGSKRNSGGERWGSCRRCGGSGEVRRFGARSG